ncbi:peptide ABC transporter permease [Rhodococcus opacus]|uniref:Peptide ABC transporter permease n=1 Tax=Rhodococcus opacus TaxID=37919 RepID=A0AAX3Y8Q7_RHOOP|nr:FtsX-like permease family protein [Rhodococcus opacus]MCZ4589807.1 peptide ABC transporter permease [Rhodococcus opacus]WLF44595.1 peptide ABC transporter permease [Rhodococcus opacus]
MFLASREIRRAPVRFGLLAGAIGLLMFLVFFQQTLASSLLNSFTGALQNQSGTVLVYSSEARNSLEASVLSPEIAAKVAAVPGVGQLGSLGEATMTLLAKGQQIDVAVIGAEAGKPGQPTKLISGRLATAPGEGVASSEARSFALGDTVTTAAGGSPVTIVGLTGQSQFNVQPTLFVTFDTFTALRKAANPDATMVLPSAVAVIPSSGVGPKALAAAINATVPQVTALSRSDAVANAPGVSSTQGSFAIVLALAVVVVALVTGFFFLILTVQKTAALTLLRAVGAPASYLVRGLIQQVVLVLGVALLVAVGLLVTATAVANTGLPLAIDPRALVISTVVVVGLSLLGVAVSVWRVLRIDPFQAVGRPGVGGIE